MTGGAWHAGPTPPPPALEPALVQDFLGACCRPQALEQLKHGFNLQLESHHREVQERINVSSPALKPAVREARGRVCVCVKFFRVVP